MMIPRDILSNHEDARCRAAALLRCTYALLDAVAALMHGAQAGPAATNATETVAEVRAAIAAIYPK